MAWETFPETLRCVSYSGAQSLVLVPGDKIQPKKKGFGLIIKCDATGLGPWEDPQLTWTSAQGNVITSTNSNDPVYVQRKGPQSLKLRIPSVQEEHTGKWTCTGVLNGQKQTMAVMFDVWEDITFTGKQYQRPTIYTDALIECRVGGSPQPEVSWSHNDKTIDGGRYIPVPNGLEIRNITKDDNGEYLCIAEIPSTGRYEEHSITVEVRAPATLTSSSKMTKDVEDKGPTMHRKASSNRPPTEKMHKDQSADFVRMNNGGRYQIIAVEGTMKILRLKVSDDGTYKCMVDVMALPLPPSTVEVVRAAQRWIRLRIGTPGNSGGLPVTGYRVQYSTTQGNNQLATIEAEIDPETTSDDGSRPMTTVDIENLNPSTLYTFSVYARTDVGLSEPKEIQFMTKEISVPEPVNILSKNASDSSSEYNLVWEKPRDGGLPIKHYVLRYRLVTYNKSNNQITDINSDFKVVIQENPDATSFKLTNLIPDRTYQIEIDAVNVLGRSDTRYIVMTTKYALPRPPSTVEVVRAAQRWIRLRIGVPENSGGPLVTGYRVQYSTTQGNNQLATIEAQLDSERTKTTVDIGNLKPSTLYTFSVYARTDVGFSEPKEIQFMTKEI
ncbi:protein sidekick-like isoform X2 [Liolophura sinensis]|uniref:protein sidekick-like isoform X2 n=1 Tax=Liolophura sinensis TaxID=3198878 RepID=UPI00315975CB